MQNVQRFTSSGFEEGIKLGYIKPNAAAWIYRDGTAGDFQMCSNSPT
jgi:hypothetical protein